MLGLVTYNVAIIYLGLGSTGIDVTSFNQMSVLVMFGINIGGFFLLILLHLISHPQLVWRLICDTISYWYYQGAYMQTLVAHAFCNVDDVSWGTKGATSKHGEGYESDKVFFVSAWYYFVYVGYFGTVFWLTFLFMWTW